MKELLVMVALKQKMEITQKMKQKKAVGKAQKHYWWIIPIIFVILIALIIWRKSK